MATAQQKASPGVYATDDVGIEVTDGVNSRVLLGLISGTNGYGLKVVSADGSTVIIDGTSDMFRISATGTLSVTVSAVNTRAASAVSLPALGSLASTLAHQCYVGVGGGANHLSYSANGVFLGAAGAAGAGWAASAVGGAANLQFLAGSVSVSLYGDLDGSSNMRVTMEAWIAGSGLSTFAGRYNVLAQVAV